MYPSNVILSRELLYFIHRAPLKNLTHAADELGVQQSGLTKAIQRLESDVEQKLFIRTQKGLWLTTFGSELYRALLLTQAHWQDQLNQSANFEQFGGGIRIGSHASVAICFFPKIIPALQSQFPRLQILTQFHRSVEVTRKVASLQLDLDFVVNPVPNPELDTKNLDGKNIAIFRHPDMSRTELAALYNPQM